jgi:hypothetical protein
MWPYLSIVGITGRCAKDPGLRGGGVKGETKPSSISRIYNSGVQWLRGFSNLRVAVRLLLCARVILVCQVWTTSATHTQWHSMDPCCYASQPFTGFIISQPLPALNDRISLSFPSLPTFTTHPLPILLDNLSSKPQKPQEMHTMSVHVGLYLCILHII